jgi:hypothetical protein
MYYKTTFIVVYLLCAVLRPSAQDTLLFGHLPAHNGKVNYHGSLTLNTQSAEEARIKIMHWYNDHYKKLVHGSDTLINKNGIGDIILSGHFLVNWKVPIFSKYLDVRNNRKVNVFHKVNLSFRNNECFYEITDFTVSVDKPRNVLRPFAEFLDIPIESLTEKTSAQKAEKFSAEVDKKVKKIIDSMLKI